jgi:serine/threonine-protein kinase
MEISATTWQTLSKLLDEALDMEPAARTAWLEQLTATQPDIAPSVRRLLAAHASSETADVMARLPPLSVRLDSGRASALSTGDRVGPYQLKRELGAGGMADVWLAERADGAFTREVALKLPMVSRLRRDLAQRFARERDILARLEHPHIARLYDAGVTDDGLPYLAMASRSPTIAINTS